MDNNKIYDNVINDLEALEIMAKELAERFPPLGAAISEKIYFENSSLHVLIISQLEYFLKGVGKIKEQWELVQVINSSKVLTPKEKAHLKYMFFTQHCVVHNGAHFDDKFLKNMKKITEIDVEKPKNDQLSVIEPFLLVTYINLVKKLMNEIKDELGIEYN